MGKAEYTPKHRGFLCSLRGNDITRYKLQCPRSLYELINWLTTVVDGLPVKDTYKVEAYQAAVQYIADCLTVCFINSFVCFACLNSSKNSWLDAK